MPKRSRAYIEAASKITEGKYYLPAEAVALAASHLDQCEADAVNLPCGAGRMLLAYCAGMRAKLDDAVSVLEAC